MALFSLGCELTRFVVILLDVDWTETKRFPLLFLFLDQEQQSSSASVRSGAEVARSLFGRMLHSAVQRAANRRRRGRPTAADAESDREGGADGGADGAEADAGSEPDVPAGTPARGQDQDGASAVQDAEDGGDEDQEVVFNISPRRSERIRNTPRRFSP